MANDEFNGLIRAVAAMRALDEHMPLQQFALFLEVAKKEGQSIGELAEKVGLPSSSTSRNIAALSKLHWLKKPGLDLVSIHVDDMELRKKLIRLTAKGRTLTDQLLRAFK